MSLDTTRSSTGKVNGASSLLQDRRGGKFLYLACRHHVHNYWESIVVSMPELSNGQNIKFFQRLSRQWGSLNPLQSELFSLSLSQ